MKKILKELGRHIESIITNKPLIIYLEAGHYLSTTGPTDFSTESLKDTIIFSRYLIKKYGKNIRVVLGILENDLGTDHAKNTKKNTLNALPSELEAIIAHDTIIKRERVLHFSETTTKNRGSSFVKKQIKNKNKKIAIDNTPEALVHIHTTHQKICIGSKTKNNTYKLYCAGIMLQHYIDVFTKVKKRFKQADSFVIIDWSEHFDKTKVVHGRQAFQSIYSSDENISLRIFNVFYTDDEGSIYSIQKP